MMPVEDPTFVDMLARLGLATLFGAVIGFDRERRQKPAGMRTMMLVSIGSAGFALTGLGLMASLISYEAVAFNPTRLISGIAGAVGFLGAGAIIRSGESVHGLTTAAGIWAVASIGLACGLGLYRVAVAVFIFTVITLLAANVLKELATPEPHDPAER